MKRINAQTKQPYKRGDIREDGKVFLQYCISKPILKTGFYAESWCSAEFYKSKKDKENKWAKENPKILRKNARTYRAKHHTKILAYNAKRRANKLKATPLWLSTKQKIEIEELYKMAKILENIFPWKQHIDHIVPLAGKNVCGLHVPWNLQILSDSKNRSKNNRQ